MTATERGFTVSVSQKPLQTGKPAGNQVNQDDLSVVKCTVGSEPTDPGDCSGFAPHLQLFSELKYSIRGPEKGRLIIHGRCPFQTDRALL